MEALAFCFWAFCLAALGGWYLRMIYANNRTYEQRIAMIENWKSLLSDEYLDELRSFRSVTYAEHKREVFWGRDPYKLYPHLKERG